MSEHLQDPESTSGPRGLNSNNLNSHLYTHLFIKAVVSQPCLEKKIHDEIRWWRHNCHGWHHPFF